MLTLGTDNGTAYTPRSFRARLTDLGVTHRRGAYRVPESQAFIESWFSKFKLRCVWREELETLADARQAIGGYINDYHHKAAQRPQLTERRTRSRQPGTITRTD
jgi:putative transposase